MAHIITLLTVVLVLLVIVFIGHLFIMLLYFGSGHNVPAKTSTLLLGSAGVVLSLIGIVVAIRRKV